MNCLPDAPPLVSHLRRGNFRHMATLADAPNSRARPETLAGGAGHCYLSLLQKAKMTKAPKPAKKSPPTAATHPRPTAARMNAYLENLQAIISKHGWAVQSVLTDVPVSYTVGLTATHGLPEIVLTGIGPEDAQGILNMAARRLVSKELTLVEGQKYSQFLESFPVQFRPVPPSEAKLLRLAALFAPEQRPVSAWQMIWPDSQGNFSGDPGMHEGFAAMQNLELVLETAEEAPQH